VVLERTPFSQDEGPKVRSSGTSGGVASAAEQTTVWFDTMRIVNLMNLFLLLVVNFISWMIKTIFSPPKQYAQGFGCEGTGQPTPDLGNFLNMAGNIGYETSNIMELYDLTETSVRNNIDNELVYFAAHGNQHEIHIAGDVNLVNSRSSYNDSNNSNRINIETISLTKPKLIIYAACMAAAGTENLAQSTIDSGAKCVIAWEKTVIGPDLEDWMEIFQDRVEQGDTILAAYNQANKYEHYYKPDDIKSAKLLGSSSNQKQKLKIN